MNIHFKFNLLLIALICAGLGANPAMAGDTLAGSYLVSQFARSNGEVDAAVSSLKAVHKSEPDNKAITSQLQGMLLLKGDIEEAVNLAAKIHKMDNKDQMSDLLLALHDIKDNNADEAAAMLDPAYESGNPQLWLPLISAWVDLSRNKLDKPLTVEELAADVGNAAPLVNYHLALINAQAGFTDAAALNYKNAIEDINHPPMRVMRMLLQFYRQNHKPAVLTPIVAAFLKAHPEAGKSATMPIATAHDGIAEVLYTMGDVMLNAEADNDAAIYMQLALYLKPNFPEAALAMGDAYSNLQQYDRADDAYGRIAEESPLYQLARLHVIVNYDRMGKLDDALSMLDAMSKQSPGDPDPLITKGDLLRMHSHYRDAIAAYDTALGRIPKLESRYWPVLFARGACYERLNNWAAAERDLQQALVLKPDQPDVLNYLGYGWMEHSEKLADAKSMIEKAVKERPDNGEIVDSMGWALYLSGDYAGAAHYLEKAVEMMPGDATVNAHLGDAYWQLGRKTEARYQWERSLNASPAPDSKLAGLLQHKLKDGMPIHSVMADEAAPVPSVPVSAPVSTAVNARNTAP